MATTLDAKSRADETTAANGELRRFASDPLETLRRLYASQGGLASLEEAGQRTVFVFDPVWNQQVLSDTDTFHSQIFPLRGPKHSALRRVTSGLINMNGQQYRHHRRLMMQAFQRSGLPAYRAAVCRATRDMLAQWQIGQRRDLREEMTVLMMRVAGDVLFGLSDPDEALRVGLKFQHIFELAHLLGMAALVTDADVTWHYEQLLAAAEDLEEAIRPMIARRRGASSHGNDILSLLVRAHEEDGSLDENELVGQIAVVFGAGNLTTAYMFVWTLFLLAQNPDILAEVQHEVREVTTGRSRDGDVLTGEAEQLPTLERVLKESMRVLPVTALAKRVASRAVGLGPLELAPGTPVVYSQFITHRIAELYADAQAFRPERWHKLSPPPYGYLPFGGGARMCPGAALAMMILRLGVSLIVDHFSLCVVDNAEVNAAVVATDLVPTGPVRVELLPPDVRGQRRPVRGNIVTMVDGLD